MSYSLHLFLKFAHMRAADARRARRQLHDVKVVDYAGLQWGMQAASHQFRNCFAKGNLAAPRVCLNFAKNIIIQR